MIYDGIIFISHVFTTIFMTGIVWFVQIVHYPLFRAIGSDRFTAYERQHVKFAGYVIAPVMLIELLTGITLIIIEESSLFWINLGLLGLIWLSTLFIQVPLHRRLSQDYSLSMISDLVGTNWIRTILWTARSMILLLILY